MFYFRKLVRPLPTSTSVTSSLATHKQTSEQPVTTSDKFQSPLSLQVWIHYLSYLQTPNSVCNNKLLFAWWKLLYEHIYWWWWIKIVKKWYLLTSKIFPIKTNNNSWVLNILLRFIIFIELRIFFCLLILGASILFIFSKE